MLYLRAKYVVASPERIIENGCVGVEKGIIQDVSRAGKSGRKVYDFGESIITPGLVNAHTHLEGPAFYGGTNSPLLPPQEFTQWAQKVIAHRKTMSISDYERTTSLGYKISALNGVTTIVDHTHLKLTYNAHRRSKLRRVLVEETVAMDKEKAEEVFAKIKSVLRSASRAVCRSGGLGDREDVRHTTQLGIAPHSPFSVSPELYRMLFDLARQQRMAFCTHLSELREEVEFLKTGGGKIKSYLRKIGRETPNWRHPGVTPVAYMKKLGILKPPAFFIHCNYLSEDDIELLARSRASVVFCPNSHYYFGHHNHPFRKLLKKGVNVSLGTDSLGSNKDLSILKEMNCIWRNYRGLSPAEIFRMGTINGAKTIMMDKTIGVLKKGYSADIAVFPIKNRAVRHTDEALLYLIEKTPQSIFTMVNGVRVS
ncbi:MAG: amidohydrolase family protein [Planctomycetota bacterium]|nr:amidohydrolase family protein [Planctomycetota bacterium]